MLLFFLAIFILFLLVYIGSSREGLTSSQLYEAQKIIKSTDIPNDKPDDRLNQIIELDLEDEQINSILNNGSIDAQQKIDNIKLLFYNLVDTRNNDPDSIYFKTVDKISSDKFFKLNDILNANHDDSDRILLISDLSIQEATFTNIIDDNSISDSVKLFGDPDGAYSGPSLSTLVNQTLFSKIYDPIPPPPPPSKTETTKSTEQSIDQSTDQSSGRSNDKKKKKKKK
jgi:hypothetical protein